MKVLFVCTGNTCRSPMAAALAQKYFKEKGMENQTDSAGLFASDGEKASENAVKAMEKYGIDLSEHRSKQLTLDMISDADVIVPMTENHRNFLLNSGVPAAKLLSLGDISDPFGGDRDIYLECAAQLDEGIRQLWK